MHVAWKESHAVPSLSDVGQGLLQGLNSGAFYLPIAPKGKFSQPHF